MNILNEKYNLIKKNYELLCINKFPNKNSSDIMEHLCTLYNYSKECNSVFETGVRGCISSWAFLKGLLDNNENIQTKKLFLNDINICEIDDLISVSKNFNINICYEWKNNLLINLEENYDITFIDTWHIYGQLKRELDKFSNFTNKYIILHDTTIDEFEGETIRVGWYAEKQSKESGITI